MIPEHRFIIMATDGLWEVVNPKACLYIINKLSSNHSSAEICRILVWIAKHRGSMDNISIILIDLKYSQTASSHPL